MLVNGRGSSLVVTLLLLSLLSVLILTQLDVMWLQQKASQQFIAEQRALHRLEQVALRLKLNTKACLIAASTNANRVLQQLTPQTACVESSDGLHYLWLIEDLGVEPCLQVVIRGQHDSTRHWRLTIRAEAEEHRYLQLRYATLAEPQVCLTHLVRYITLGLVSWRLGSI